MPNYILRDIPLELWVHVKGRAQVLGWPLRALILRLLKDFAEERITPSGQPDPWSVEQRRHLYERLKKEFDKS